MQDEKVERLLQVGIECGSLGEEFYVYGDIFLECGANSEFDILDGSNFTCLQPIVVPGSDDQTHFIPTVEIFTDYRWPLFTSDLCYNFTTVRRRELTERGVSNGIDFPESASSATARSSWLYLFSMTVFAASALFFERWRF